MKNLFFLAVLSIIGFKSFTQQSFSWATLNSGTTENINAMYFHNADTGYIVGNNYLFKKTTDGGITWTSLTAPSIGEKPGNNGKIIAIDYFVPTRHGMLNNGLYLTWENGYHSVVTNDDGISYTAIGYADSSQFCKIEGFLTYPNGRLTTFGYKDVYTFGESCSGDATFHNYFDGPFSTSRSDTFQTVSQGRFTTADADSISIIFGHNEGYLLKYQRPFSFRDTTYLDSSGVTAIAHAGGNKWYVSTNRDFYNMYVSFDGGSSYDIDSSFAPTFYYPKVKEFSFLENGFGVGASASNGTNGVILVRYNNQWEYYNAQHPLNTTKIVTNGVIYVAGDNGLIMKTRITTSIEKNNFLSKNIVIYPNPTSDNIQIKGLDGLTINSIDLLDLQGKLIKSYSSNHTTFNISNQNEGVYFLKITLENREVITRKVMVK